MGPLWDLCGTSVGFSMMYCPPKLRVVPADVRLRVNHQFDVLHRSLGVVASPGFQSSLFDGLEGLCDHSRTSSSGTFDEFSSRFRSLPASSGLQDSLHQPPWSPGDSPSRASSCSRPLKRWFLPRLLGFWRRFGFFRNTYGAFFHVFFRPALNVSSASSSTLNVSSASRIRYCCCAMNKCLRG